MSAPGSAVWCGRVFRWLRKPKDLCKPKTLPVDFIYQVNIPLINTIHRHHRSPVHDAIVLFEGLFGFVEA